MEVLEILDRIEAIIKDQNKQSVESSQHSGSEEKTKESNIKTVTNLLLSFLLSILKAPFQLIAKYLKNEIITTVKKDARLYALVMGLMGVMFVFFVVLWLFISVAVGVYFYESGNTILVAIIYSIGFQLISFVLVALIAFFASRNIKSLKMLKSMP